MGVDVPADVYTIPYAVKMILEAKRRREAGAVSYTHLPTFYRKKNPLSQCLAALPAPPKGGAFWHLLVFRS